MGVNLSFPAPGKFLPISVKVSLLPEINALLQLSNVFTLSLLNDANEFLKYLWQTDVSGIAIETYVGCGDLHKIINCCACHVLGIRQPNGSPEVLLIMRVIIMMLGETYEK